MVMGLSILAFQIMLRVDHQYHDENTGIHSFHDDEPSVGALAYGRHDALSALFLVEYQQLAKSRSWSVVSIPVESLGSWTEICVRLTFRFLKFFAYAW